MKLVIAVALLCLLPLCTAQDQLINNLPEPQQLLAELPSASPISRISSIILRDQLLGNKDQDCHKCIEKGVIHILNATWNHIEKECSNSTGVYKLRCDYLLTHPNQTFGYLSVKMKPAAISWGYCVGKGTCKHGNKSDIIPDNVDPKVALAESARVFEKVLNEYTPEDADKDADRWGSLQEKLEKKLNRMDDAELTDEIDDDDEEENDVGVVCKVCLKFTTEHVLKGKLKKIKKACEHTKCPKLKKWCEWAEKNKDFVRGQVYAEVEPYKYATGFCLGVKACPHPKPALTWDSMMGKSKRHH